MAELDPLDETSLDTTHREEYEALVDSFFTVEPVQDSWAPSLPPKHEVEAAPSVERSTALVALTSCVAIVSTLLGFTLGWAFALGLFMTYSVVAFAGHYTLRHIDKKNRAKLDNFDDFAPYLQRELAKPGAKEHLRDNPKSAKHFRNEIARLKDSAARREDDVEQRLNGKLQEAKKALDAKDANIQEITNNLKTHLQDELDRETYNKSLPQAQRPRMYERLQPEPAMPWDGRITAERIYPPNYTEQNYNEAAQDKRIRDRLWLQAKARHDGIADQWGPMVSDPLSILEHAALLDVTNAHTAAFIEAYGRLTDLASILGSSCPADRASVDEYATLAREAETKWASALTQAERMKYDWLPEAERNSARKAAGLLASAADESYTIEVRANYARKAADLLTRITTVTIPTEALKAIEIKYKELKS